MNNINSYRKVSTKSDILGCLFPWVESDSEDRVIHLFITSMITDAIWPHDARLPINSNCIYLLSIITVTFVFISCQYWAIITKPYLYLTAYQDFWIPYLSQGVIRWPAWSHCCVLRCTCRWVRQQVAQATCYFTGSPSSFEKITIVQNSSK